MPFTAARFAVLGAILCVVMASGAGAAFAAEGDCTATLNGVDIERVDSLNSPLELSATDTLVFAGTDPSSTETAGVAIIIGPVTVDRGSTTYGEPAIEFSASLDLDEVSPYGVGLVRVEGSTDGCRVEGWLRISGRFPLATLTGLTAAGLAVGGVTGLLGAIASRRRWSRVAAAVAGLFAGVGGAVLGQQFGRLQLSYPSLGLSAVGAALLGFLLGSVLRPARSDPGPNDSDTRPVPEPEPAPAGSRSLASAPRPTPAPAWSRTDQETRIEEPPPGPYWCYVLAEVDVFDLTDHTRVVTRLRPGSWYLCKREVGGWAHVSSGDGPDGWVAKASIHRQG